MDQRPCEAGATYAVLGVVWLLVVGGIAVGQWPSRYGQLDSPAAETEIERWASENGATQPHVTCPTGIDIEAGRQFHCVLTDDEGESLSVTVTIENDDGYITWHLG